MVSAKSLTSWHNDVCQLNVGFDVLLKRRLHKLVVLLDDPLDVPPALCDGKKAEGRKENVTFSLLLALLFGHLPPPSSVV